MNHYSHYPPPPLPTEEYLPPPPPPPPPEDHPPPPKRWEDMFDDATETSVSDIISPQPSPPPPPPPPEKAPERTTISDDRSAGSNLEVRNLAALKDRTAPRVDHADEYWTSPAPPPPLPYDPNIPPSAPIFEVTSGRIKKSKKKRKMTSEYDSSRGHVRLQQRFGRLHLEGVTTNDVYGQNQDQSKDNPFGNSSPDSHRHSRPEPVSREHWVQNVERVDTTSRLQTDIEVLQHKVLSMQNELRQLEMQKSMHVEKQYQILYRIENICYFDHPEWSPGHKNIVSRIPVKNLDLFLERNKRIVFIVYRDFNIPVAEKETKNTSSQPSHDTQPRPAKESIQPVSRRLRKALEIMLKHDWRYEAMSNHLRQAGEVSAPYLFVYHNRRYWKDMLAQFPQAVREHLNFLAIYVSGNYGHEYKAADTALAQRKITADLVKYLFQPGDILLSQINGQYRGLVANSWPQEIPSAPAIVPSRLPPPMIIYPHLNSHHWQYSDSEFDNSDVDLDPVQSNSDPAAMTEEEAFKRAFDRMHPWFASKEEELAKSVAAAKANKEFHIKVWKWSFDGDFKREGDKVTLRLSQAGESTFGEAKTWNIHELDIYPLRFAPHALAQDLRRRGEMFWECRKRCLISYRETSPEAQNESDERFMIDFHTFRKLHPENKSHAISDPAETMSQAEMEQAQPPDEAFYYLVPLQTKGFNLRSKKWLDLNMDQITPVDWNQKAFDSLVLDRKTKELITALVSKQISAAKSTDVIAGKGNGLILLLHGGPGTGKTLTAEGVAEIAKKPLYRVTCGDVGTKAEEVEGYLESVLHLGKIWDCVVLLDEAEVFLERRSLDDLQRNALVSVFLRVIEYHEGILILTSNRVGTFDEAFRSRIQIAVHYPPLRAFQRLQIWRNFFDRLESFKDGTVDVDELRDHLEELQEVEINGRQIRNAITTARQYAEWKGKVMNYEHLKTALDVASKFDDYSEKLRGGLTDDQIAEEEGIR